jgi:hypothetical protein
VVAKKEPFSFFGKPAPKKAAPVAPKPAPVAPKKEPFSFFGAPRASGTISIRSTTADGGKKKKAITKKTAAAAPKDKIPVLKKFVQNSDGTLTGIISNSQSFRSGTRITTSPVRKGVKSGQVVKTGSGSQYRLE